ncbi:hypothetical protein SprV_0702289300 [Sparganum proliferum]
MRAEEENAAANYVAASAAAAAEREESHFDGSRTAAQTALLLPPPPQPRSTADVQSQEEAVDRQEPLQIIQYIVNRELPGDKPSEQKAVVMPASRTQTETLDEHNVDEKTDTDNVPVAATPMCKEASTPLKTVEGEQERSVYIPIMSGGDQDAATKVHAASAAEVSTAAPADADVTVTDESNVDRSIAQPELPELLQAGMSATADLNSDEEAVDRLEHLQSMQDLVNEELPGDRLSEQQVKADMPAYRKHSKPLDNQRDDEQADTFHVPAATSATDTAAAEASAVSAPPVTTFSANATETDESNIEPELPSPLLLPPPQAPNIADLHSDEEGVDKLGCIQSLNDLGTDEPVRDRLREEQEEVDLPASRRQSKPLDGQRGDEQADTCHVPVVATPMSKEESPTLRTEEGELEQTKETPSMREEDGDAAATSATDIATAATSAVSAVPASTTSADDTVADASNIDRSIIESHLPPQVPATAVLHSGEEAMDRLEPITSIHDLANEGSPGDRLIEEQAAATDMPASRRQSKPLDDHCEAAHADTGHAPAAGTPICRVESPPLDTEEGGQEQTKSTLSTRAEEEDAAAKFLTTSAAAATESDESHIDGSMPETKMPLLLPTPQAPFTADVHTDAGAVDGLEPLHSMQELVNEELPGDRLSEQQVKTDMAAFRRQSKPLDDQRNDEEEDTGHVPDAIMPLRLDESPHLETEEVKREQKQAEETPSMREDDSDAAARHAPATTLAPAAAVVDAAAALAAGAAVTDESNIDRSIIEPQMPPHVPATADLHSDEEAVNRLESIQSPHDLGNDLPAGDRLSWEQEDVDMPASRRQSKPLDDQREDEEEDTGHVPVAATLMSKEESPSLQTKEGERQQTKQTPSMREEDVDADVTSATDITAADASAVSALPATITSANATVTGESNIDRSIIELQMPPHVPATADLHSDEEALDRMQHIQTFHDLANEGLPGDRLIEPQATVDLPASRRQSKPQDDKQQEHEQADTGHVPVAATLMSKEESPSLQTKEGERQQTKETPSMREEDGDAAASSDPSIAAAAVSVTPASTTSADAAVTVESNIDRSIIEPHLPPRVPLPPTYTQTRKQWTGWSLFKTFMTLQMKGSLETD